MLDANLRQSPLAHLALERDARDERDPVHGIGLSERPFRAIIDLRAREDEVIAALGAALGAPLPLAANRVSLGSKARALWLGPDQWWAVAEAVEGSTLAGRLAAPVAGRFVAVTDVSEYYTTLRLEGPRARDLLAKGCPLDLHPRVFKAGFCAQSLLAKAGVLLELREEGAGKSGPGPTFDLYVRRSFAEYLWSWLLDGAREYGCSVLRS